MAYKKSFVVIGRRGRRERKRRGRLEGGVKIMPYRE